MVKLIQKKINKIDAVFVRFSEKILKIILLNNVLLVPIFKSYFTKQFEKNNSKEV